jgi:hypothetical protein
MLSAPRVSSTRPLSPVRIETPALSAVSLASATGCAPGASIQTSPDDLLTRHAACCAIADEIAATRTVALSRNAFDSNLIRFNIGCLAVGGYGSRNGPAARQQTRQNHSIFAYG